MLFKLRDTLCRENISASGLLGFRHRIVALHIRRHIISPIYIINLGVAAQSIFIAINSINNKLLKRGKVVFKFGGCATILILKIVDKPARESRVSVLGNHFVYYSIISYSLIILVSEEPLSVGFIHRDSVCKALVVLYHLLHRLYYLPLQLLGEDTRTLLYVKRLSLGIVVTQLTHT